jgi:hypothetical protein
MGRERDPSEGLTGHAPDREPERDLVAVEVRQVVRRDLGLLMAA